MSDLMARVPSLDKFLFVASLRLGLYIVSVLHVLVYIWFPIMVLTSGGDGGPVHGHALLEVILVVLCVLYDASAINAAYKAMLARDSTEDVGGNRRAGRWARVWSFSLFCNFFLNLVVFFIALFKGESEWFQHLVVWVVCLYSFWVVISWARQRDEYRDGTARQYEGLVGDGAAPAGATPVVVGDATG